MEFSRVGKHTIKCVISEDEIVELGFTLEEIIGNGERTQEFMNQIFDLAERQRPASSESFLRPYKAYRSR